MTEQTVHLIRPEKGVIRIQHQNPSNNDWFVVNWCLGNTCNFECSYCPEGLHNATQPWPDIEVVKAFILNIKAHHAPKQMFFEFTGGEVTLYRHFDELAEFCHEQNVKIGFISNGSRTLRWWKEKKHLFDHVCLSFHPEEGDEDHFIKVVEEVKDTIMTHVNIMMSPDDFDRCYAIARRFKKVTNISIALQPLIHDFGEEVYDYTQEQKDVLHDQYNLIVKHIQWTKPPKHYRGAMLKHYVDGRTPVASSAHRFISTKTNNWSGWDCYAGVEQLIVDMDGSIYRGWCKVGGAIGNIHDAQLNLPVDPIRCNKMMCHCNFDIMSTKVKV
jgi:MoaA/NifB/PqqE/SkfB family radical SAM enzyme